MDVTVALRGRGKKEDLKLEASLGYIIKRLSHNPPPKKDPKT
jgi:hypothetical protein